MPQLPDLHVRENKVGHKIHNYRILQSHKLQHKANKPFYSSFLPCTLKERKIIIYTKHTNNKKRKSYKTAHYIKITTTSKSPNFETIPREENENFIINKLI